MIHQLVKTAHSKQLLAMHLQEGQNLPTECIMNPTKANNEQQVALKI